MIGLAAIELSHIEAAGTVTGFLGLCGYLGAAISGGPVGFTIQHYGWHALFGSLALLGNSLYALSITNMEQGRI